MRPGIRHWTAIAAALAVAIACAGSASAADVILRIEGAQRTLFEGPVSTTAHPVDGGDGTGPHPCSGGLGSTPGPTATTALDDGARAAGIPWRGRWNPDFYDFFVDTIGPDTSTPPDGYWGILVNGRSAGGGCTTKVQDGDEVLWVYGAAFKPNVLRLTGPTEAAVGQPFTVSVTASGEPVAGASVGGALTDSSGRATLMRDQPARLYLKAERSDAIRSNALTVCVGVEQGCEASVAPGTGPGQGGVPRLTIAKIDRGARFARGAGPRILRGEAEALTGVGLELIARERGRCLSWDAERRRLTAGPCGRPHTFAAALRDGGWRARIGRLPPGRYTLRARSTGGEGRTAAVSFRILERSGSARTLLVRGLDYLTGVQRDGGGFGADGRAAPSPLMTGWATMALGGLRDGPARRGARHLRRELRAAAPIADQVRTAFALARAGGRTNRAQTRRLCRRIVARRHANGSLGADVNVTAMGVLALRAPGCARRAAVRAARWLAAQRSADGGFGFRPGTPSDVDTTALATWALASVPPTRAAATRSTGYLRRTQNHDGGFGNSPGMESNSQSTGLTIAALRAVGVRSAAVRTEDGIDPVDYLTTLQLRSGAIAYQGRAVRTPVWTTSQALLGLGDRTPRRTIR